MVRQNQLPTFAHTLLDTGGETLTCAGHCGVIRSLTRFNPFADSAAFRESQIVIILKLEPKLRGQTEILAQTNGSVSTDGSVSPETP